MFSTASRKLRSDIHWKALKSETRLQDSLLTISDIVTSDDISLGEKGDNTRGGGQSVEGVAREDFLIIARSHPPVLTQSPDLAAFYRRGKEQIHFIVFAVWNGQ